MLSCVSPSNITLESNKERMQESWCELCFVLQLYQRKKNHVNNISKKDIYDKYVWKMCG